MKFNQKQKEGTVKTVKIRHISHTDEFESDKGYFAGNCHKEKITN